MVKTSIGLRSEELYTKSFLNYAGETSNTKVKYTEVVAEFLANNYANTLRPIGKKLQIPVRDNWNGLQHNGTIDPATKQTRYSEKWLAIALFNTGQQYPFGRVFDYEVPLKRVRKDNKYGKVDIVSLDGELIRLIELKIKNKNNESLLRALLEIYTYYKLLRNSKEQFMNHMRVMTKTPAIQDFLPCILTEDDTRSADEIQNIKNHPLLTSLIKQISNEIGRDMEFYIYNTINQKPSLDKGSSKVLLKSAFTIRTKLVISRNAIRFS